MYYRNYAHIVNDVSDATSGEYAVVADNEVYSVNKSAYLLWTGSRLFLPYDADSGLQVLREIYLIEDEDTALSEIQQCMEQMCDSGLLLFHGSDEVKKTEESCWDIRRTLEGKGYCEVECSEWFGEFRRTYSKRLLVSSDIKVDLNWFEEICEEDDYEEGDETTHKTAVVFPGETMVQIVNREYLKATRGPGAEEGMEKYTIGKPLLPSRLASMVPKKSERYSLREEGEKWAFVYDFLEDQLKIANRTAVFILECVDGNHTIEEITMMSLKHFSECTEDFDPERVMKDVISFIGLLENGEIIFYE